MRRVVVTGIGAVTPLGNNAPSTWRSLMAGRSGVREIATFDASTFPVRIAGQVEGFSVAEAVPDRRDRRHLSRSAGYGVAAALEALRQAGDLDGTDPWRRGVSVGGTVGRVELQELADMSWLLESTKHSQIFRQSPNEVLARDQNVGPAVIARLGDCRGPYVSVSTACAGAGHAIGEAYRLVQEGDADMMVAGGTDALTTWMDVLGFCLLGALTADDADAPERASKPFDARRSGFVLGEGAVMAVLEERDHALARGAAALGELVGYGSSLNAYRITDSPPDGGGCIIAMREALAESGLRPTDIDYVVSHGTGTPGNDSSETVAIKEVFGAHAYDLAISSPKSMAGHLTSAAAGLNLLAALGAIADQVVPPTINLTHPDPRLDLDYVPGVARRQPVRAAMVNAFAFGGTNACLVVRTPEPAGPAGLGAAVAEEPLPAPTAAAPPPPAPAVSVEQLLRAAERGGLDRLLDLAPGQAGTAVRNVPATWPLLATHFPRKPVMPGVLILDDLATLAGLVADAATTGPDRGDWSLTGARRVRWRHFVQPGDCVELTVVRLGGAEGDPAFSGTVRVDGRTVATVAELRVRWTRWAPAGVVR
ncbi:beta-ketoacyl-ACP synthase II [Phytohabitans houttuyneae]|uniref:Ketosynthase family 3 (KS3) domain-containing protein n=1 Tax=Phytohabitans houttuyneae TaxID=1076126 RepID=A0A6V8KLI8_9ACTN|nr:beta-ketoacyl-ACP synthase II [Phytohabitans houttuyneae]GFJ83378.1 hypothetical protein Phou_075580 [Phytohabitans houttuyneae]